MYIKREAESLFNRFSTSNKIGIVIGARQVGKTTLAQHLMAGQSTLFLNFDIEMDKARFITASALSPTDAITYLGNPSILVIDEAQRLPETSRIIKGWYDAGVSVKFVLLGFSSLDLLDQSAESLTGRNWKLKLPPPAFRGDSYHPGMGTTACHARTHNRALCTTVARLPDAAHGLWQLPRSSHSF